MTQAISIHLLEYNFYSYIVLYYYYNFQLVRREVETFEKYICLLYTPDLSHHHYCYN